MNAETEVSGVRISWWNSGGYDQIRAEWSGEAIPDGLVHNLLGRIRPIAGGAELRVDGYPAISLDIRITFGTSPSEDLPF